MPAQGRNHWITPLVFVTPALVLYLAFTIVPLITVFFFGMQEFEGAARRGFVGFDNYTRLINSPTLAPQIWQAFLNNWAFFLGTLVIQNTLGLGLAILIARTDGGRRFFQTIIAIPFLVNPLVVGYVWTLLLNPNFGPVAQMLDQMGRPDLIRPWLGEPALARPITILINAWQWVGFPMLIFGAALGAIPGEITEAARLDSERRWPIFRSITLPLLMPAIGTVTVLTFIGCFNAFNLQFAVGGVNGGPAGANDVLGLVFYRLAFSGDMNAIGVSSALATTTFAFVMVVALFLRRMLARIEEAVT